MGAKDPLYFPSYLENKPIVKWFETYWNRYKQVDFIE